MQPTPRQTSGQCERKRQATCRRCPRRTGTQQPIWHRGDQFLNLATAMPILLRPSRDTGAVSSAVSGSPTHAAPAVTASAVVTAPPMPQPIAIPLAGVPIEIASKALAGKNRFEIRLDPPELGRIEVRLDVDHDGNVTSRLTVDRADTLDLLRRDASGLERALAGCGPQDRRQRPAILAARSIHEPAANEQRTERRTDCREATKRCRRSTLFRRTMAVSPGKAAVSIFASEDQP